MPRFGPPAAIAGKAGRALAEVSGPARQHDKGVADVLATPYLPAKLPSPANAETAISDIAEGLGISLIRVFPYTASSKFNCDPAPGP